MASDAARTATKLPPRGGLPAGRDYPVALTIAGFDPSSGAGVAADLKTFWNHRLYGVSAITALTVQSTRGVGGIEPVSGRLLRQTLDCLAADLPLAGIKIGMLATAENVETLASFLGEGGVDRSRIVLDPVIRSSSGAELLSQEGVRKLRDELLPQVGWVTPNLDELAALTGEGGVTRENVPDLAGRLAAMTPGLNVVVTGGHLYPPDDFLLTADGPTQGQAQWLPGRRIETTSTHGTGCVFSSALLCRLVLGDLSADAVANAKAWVTQALETAVPLGKGRGPVLT
jgi:hydroxymethylpyrimidine/phosphomethylpyrimidine kinase